MYKITVFLIVLIAFSCRSKHESPEEVIEKFSKLLSKGDCEKAEEFCVSNALEDVESFKDNGCEPYVLEIDTIECEIRDSVARCICYENRLVMSGMQRPYALVFRDGDWKIFDLSQDSAPWEYIDALINGIEF